MEIVIQRRRYSLPILPVLAAVVLAILALTTLRIGRIQPGEIGVLVNNVTGKIDARVQEGASFYNGLLTDFYVLDNSVQTIKMTAAHDDAVRIKTDDGSDVTMDVDVNYRLVQDPQVLVDRVIPETGLARLAAVSGGDRRRGLEMVDAYRAKWVRDYARSVIRYVFGELDTKTFYNATERNQKTLQAQEELNRLLQPHGIEIQQVVPDVFRFIEEFEQVIAKTQEASEQVESEQRKAETAIEDQKRQEREAEAKVLREIASMRGRLDKEVLIAQAAAARETRAAEAYAYTKQQGADAQFYMAKNDAQSMLATASAEAEGLKQLAASLSGSGGKNLVKMEYAKVLQGATIQGLPYSTDPRIQRVEVTGTGSTPAIPSAAGAAQATGGQR